LLLLPVDDLASFPVQDDDFRADDPKVGTYGQQFHSGSAIAFGVIITQVVAQGVEHKVSGL